MKETKKLKLNLGPTQRKILLILSGGVTLSLTSRPDNYFRIIRKIAKEWKKINELSLRRSIKRLYKSKLIDYKEERDGVIKLILSENGKNKILEYNFNDIEIKKPERWDGLWRLVIFDIPEDKKSAREALVFRLKRFDFCPIQKSVFIHPYECKNEKDFVVEMFKLAPYVRFLRVKDIDIELDLKNLFHL